MYDCAWFLGSWTFILDKAFGESEIHSIINERSSSIVILRMKGLVTGTM